jgi:hypothetical protein
LSLEATGALREFLEIEELLIPPNLPFETEKHEQSVQQIGVTRIAPALATASRSNCPAAARNCAGW